MACIFCRIIAGEIPSEILYQDEKAIVIRDIEPKAPKHFLVLPRAHIASLADLAEEQTPLVGHLVHIANQLAKREGVARGGYRLILNCGPDAGQVVPHLHLHLLAGRELGEMG